MNRLIFLSASTLLLAALPGNAQQAPADAQGEASAAAQAEKVVQQAPVFPNINDGVTAVQSLNGTYALTAEPALQPMRLNTMHYWTLHLTDTENQPVSDAVFRVDGGMPGHGHGLPTAPRVSAGDEPGQYILKGLRFNMSGEWLLQFDISANGASDKVRVLFSVADTTAS